MAATDFEVTVNTKDFDQSIRRIIAEMKEVDKTSKDTGNSIDGMGKKIAGAAAAYFSIQQAQQFLNKVIEIRGQFQKLDIAFTTMLQGNREASSKLMNELTEFASVTPFGLMDAASGAKQLLAYGFDVKNVVKDMEMLGNVASGVSAPLNDIVYLYGTLKASGRVATMDIRQFAGRGIPIYRELAEVLGVAEGEINDLVSAGRVGFKDIEKAFQRMTGQGGTFYNLMREQSKSLPGQISNLEDSIDMMFNEIGAALEGFISKGIEGAAWLVENYEKVGRTLLELVGAYGAYKVALVSVKALMSGMTTAELKHYAAIVAKEKAQKLLNRTMLNNPYVIAAAALAGLAYGMYKLITYQNEYQKQQEELNDSFSKAQTEAAKEVAELDRLRGKLEACEENTDTYKKTKEEIVSKFGKYDDTLKAETLSVKTLTDKYKSLSDAIAAAANKRMYNDWLSKSTEKYNTKETELLDEIYDDLADEYGSKKAAELQQRLLNALYAGKNPLNYVHNKKDYDSELAVALRESWKLDEAKELIQAYQAFEEAKKIAKQRFNITDEVSEDEDENEDYTPQDNVPDLTKAKNLSADYAREMAKQVVDAQLEIRQASIDAMNEGFAKENAQLELNYHKQLQEITNMESEMVEKLRDYEQKKWEQANPEAKKQGKVFDRSSITADNLSPEQKQIIADMYAQAYEAKRNASAQLVNAEFAAMQETLKQYGTFQQQKLSLATEYAEKIAKAETEAQKTALERQRDSELANIEAQALKANIDWATVFGEFGGMFESILRPALQQAQDYIQTDAFKNADQDSQKALIEAIQQMTQSLGGVNKVSFAKLGQDVNTYQIALKNLNNAQDAYKDTYETLVQAQKTYENALKYGTEEQQQAAKRALETAQTNEQAAASWVESMQQVANNAQNIVNTTATTLKTSIGGVMSGLQKMTGGSLSGIYVGLQEFGDNLSKLENAGKLGEVFGNLAEKLKDTPIIGAIFELLDIFKDGIGVVFASIIDTIFSAVSNILNDVLNLKDGFLRQIGEAGIKGIWGVFKSVLTLGGWFDWIGDGESDKTLEKDTELMSSSNEALKRSIDHLSNVIAETAVANAKIEYERQKKLLNESEANTLEMMQRSADAYKRGFGGSHSSAYRINEEITANEWNRVSGIIGKNITGAADFFMLSSEEMRKVALELPDVYGRIKAIADDGHKDAAQYMDDYIEFAEQREELEKQYKETLTNISFDALKDEFKEALLDMDMSAEEFAENLNELLKDAVADGIMDKYNDDIQEWYDMWAKAMEDGRIDAAEQAILDARRDTIYKSIEKDKEALNEQFGGEAEEAERQSSSRGIATASQESVDENNARLTTIQAHTASIVGNVDEMVKEIREQRLTSLRTAQIADDIRANTIEMIRHLQGIESNTGTTNSKLDKISNTLTDIQLKGVKMK